LLVNFFQYVWRYSRREQIIVLGYVLASLPFYWWSLDVPKRIVNEAIQGGAFTNGHTRARFFEMTLTLPDFLGGGSYHLSDGFMLEQLPYLYALSMVFLALTLINGWFKYVINIRKGILGERMLRRLRFDLFALVLRFRPEDIRTTKSAEVASMIKDEVEPIGGFFGEAFITPAFLGTQAITAMTFIMTQNMWLGLIAFGLIAVQGFVIPRLRREQIRLGRERQLESRTLSGRIGEFVEAAPAIHAYGVTHYSGADIGKRLGTLFDIRLRLYRRKFAVKYLNNLLAQLTPFVFYILGGYLALNGRLDIGQLVAVIAAYRDLPTPIKELIDWDQQRADVTVKYEQVVGAFSKDVLLPPEPETDGDPIPADADIGVSGLRVVNSRGIVQLDRVTTTLPRPSRIALVGGAGSGRDVLAKVLGRQITDYQGSVTIGGRELGTMTDRAASRSVIYASSEPHIMSGSIRDNLLFALRDAVPPVPEDLDAKARAELIEARMTANPLVSPDDDWIDYSGVGASGPDELDGAIIEALRVVRGYDDIFRVGFASRLGDDVDPALATRLLESRSAILDHFRERGLLKFVEPFEAGAFNMNASIGENLLFGVPVGSRFAPENLAQDNFVRAIISAEALAGPLLAIGLKIVETVADVFQGMAADNPLRERYSFIDEGDLETLLPALQGNWLDNQRERIPSAVRQQLIGYGLMYVEPRHRLNMMDDDLVARVLRARKSFRQFLPASEAGAIEFYDAGRLMPAAPIRDNLLPGRIRYGKMHERARLLAAVAEVLQQRGLETFVVSKGLDQDAGPGGRLLSPQQRATIQLARLMLRRPDTLVLDGALSSFSGSEAHMMMKNICAAMEGRTLIVSQSEEDDVSDFDIVLTFDGAKLTSVVRENEMSAAGEIENTGENRATLVPEPSGAADAGASPPTPQEVGK
jgi:putative ABC transport system ATP-binding protein